MSMCSILDIRCILVNELIGSVALSIVFVLILYFIIASKAKLGFDTTIWLLVPISLIGSLIIIGWTVMFLVLGSLLAAVLAAYVLNRMIGNR